MTSLLRFPPNELEEVLAALEAPRYRSDQVLRALYQGGSDSIDDGESYEGRAQECDVHGGATQYAL